MAARHTRALLRCWILLVAIMAAACITGPAHAAIGEPSYVSFARVARAAVLMSVVLERVVIDAGGVCPSYLGPPESVRVARQAR